MYNELYTAWRKEIEEASLGSLPSDFSARIAEYLKLIKEENKMLDKKSLKATLLDNEARNAKRMIKELLCMRYEKIVKALTQNQDLPSELLTAEEAKMRESFGAFTDAYQRFIGNLLQGHTPEVDVEISRKRWVLRFTKNIPAIVGTDMKTYGPFLVEDVASIPVENAKILIRQGLAVQVEVS
jgi:DNA replication initiation complex subunit (GINS family)